MSSRVTIANALANRASAMSGLPPPGAPLGNLPALRPLALPALPFEASEAERSAFRAGASVLVDQLRFARTVFEQYGGKRDFAKVLGYKKAIDFQEYVDQYERGDIAQRIVDIPAEETWFGFPDVVDADGRDGDFSKAWKRLASRLNLSEMFCRFDRAAGIGSFGVALVGLRGQNLGQPIHPVSSPDDVLYVSVFSQGSVTLGKTITKPDDPNYGKPETYTLDFGTSASAGANPPVHISRILHLAEGRLESDLYGIPRLKPVFNRLYDLAKIVGGSAETFWLAANKGLHANIDPNLVRQIKQKDLDALSDNMELYRDQLTRLIKTVGVELTDLGSDVVNPRGVFAVVAAIISGATRIPIRMLFPETRGAATSINDRVAFREEIVLPRQKRVAEPQVIRPFVNMMIAINALPPPKSIDTGIQNEFSVLWPDPVSRSIVDQTEIALKRATIVEHLSRARSLAPILTPKQEAEIIGVEGETLPVEPAPPAKTPPTAPTSPTPPTPPPDQSPTPPPVTPAPPKAKGTKVPPPKPKAAPPTGVPGAQ